MARAILLAAVLATVSPAQATQAEIATQLTATIPVNGSIALHRIHQALTQRLHHLRPPPLVAGFHQPPEPGPESAKPQVAHANGNHVR